MKKICRLVKQELERSVRRAWNPWMLLLHQNKPAKAEKLRSWSHVKISWGENCKRNLFHSMMGPYCVFFPHGTFLRQVQQSLRQEARNCRKAASLKYELVSWLLSKVLWCSGMWKMWICGVPVRERPVCFRTWGLFASQWEMARI